MKKQKPIFEHELGQLSEQINDKFSVTLAAEVNAKVDIIET